LWRVVCTRLWDRILPPTLSEHRTPIDHPYDSQHACIALHVFQENVSFFSLGGKIGCVCSPFRRRPPFEECRARQAVCLRVRSRLRLARHWRSSCACMYVSSSVQFSHKLHEKILPKKYSMRPKKYDTPTSLYSHQTVLSARNQKSNFSPSLLLLFAPRTMTLAKGVDSPMRGRKVAAGNRTRNASIGSSNRCDQRYHTFFFPSSPNWMV
jgi:hypothetical protein